MPITFIDSKPPPSEAELDALEHRLQIKLPENYRHFLLEHNGGRPVPKGFSFVEDSHGLTGSSIAWFLAVHDGPYSNFEKDYYVYKVRNRRLPDNLMPIAHDPFSNQICMSFGGDDKGAIYFWDHEIEADEGEEATYRNCYLIAPTLEQFLDGLRDLQVPSQP